MTPESEGDRQAQLALEVLSMFVEKGEDLSDERHVIHYMYDGNWEAMGASLTELGYQVRPTVNADGLVAERTEVTDAQWAVHTMHQMCEIAAQYGVEYDGWEGAMVRQPTATGTPPSEPPKSSGLFAKLFGKKH